MTLENIRKNNSLDKLLGAVKEENQPQEKKSYTDERLWKPELDKSGNGYAVLRFLPAVHGEDLPWAKVYTHAFQGPTGQWYIENSLTSVGGKDPVSEYNSKLWNTPNLVITPHVSSDDHGSYVKMTLDLFVKNLKLFISNKELVNKIDKNLGY